jgi:putative transposase
LHGCSRGGSDLTRDGHDQPDGAQAKTPGKPTDNGLIEAFSGRLRAECLNEHWFLNLADAQGKLDAWREDYNGQRPHGSLGDMAPADFAKQTAEAPAEGNPDDGHDTADGAPETGPTLRLTGWELSLRVVPGRGLGQAG